MDFSLTTEQKMLIATVRGFIRDELAPLETNRPARSGQGEAIFEVAVVKVQASETLGRVVDRAVQAFGGMGFCKDLPIERYYRDARIYRIFDGTSEIHRVSIARSVMKNGANVYDILG